MTVTFSAEAIAAIGAQRSSLQLTSEAGSLLERAALLANKFPRFVRTFSAELGAEDILVLYSNAAAHVAVAAADLERALTDMHAIRGSLIGLLPDDIELPTLMKPADLAFLPEQLRTLPGADAIDDPFDDD